MEQRDEHHFLYKRLIVECDQWICRNVVCLGNQIHHTEEQKEAFISGIGERIARQVMPEQPDFALTVATTLYTLVEQEAWIVYWKYQLASPLRLFSDIEAITRETENHHNLQKSLPVKYHYNTEMESSDDVWLLPAEVVCILSFAKDRRRVILRRKTYTDRPVEYNTYLLDTQTLPNGESQNFENIRDYLDPLKIYLVATSNAIFNEAFYDFDGNNMKLHSDIKFKIKIKDFDDDRFRVIPLNKRPADKNKVHQELIACRENKRNHLNSLQNQSSFYTYHKGMQEGK